MSTAETSSVGGPLETIGSPCLSSSVPIGADAALGDLDARHRLDLVQRVGGHRRRDQKSALTAWRASTDDVDALLRALEEVLERLVDRVREDQRADHEGDADDDREAGQDRPQLARQQARGARAWSLATAFIRSSTPSASVPAPSWTTSPSRRTTIRSATAAACGVVGDHDHRLVELVDGLAQQAQDLLGGVRVQVAGRLVGEQHGGPVHERARHRDALLLAAGELRRAGA